MADRYLVASGNWNSTGTWSASSGGPSGASFPVAGDNAFIDANSNGFNLTINVASACATLDCSGAIATTITHAASVALTVGGLLFRLAAGITYTLGSSTTSTLSFTSTSGTCLITTAGKLMGPVTFNGAGGTFQLQDAWTSALGVTPTIAMTLTAGTLDFNDFNVTLSVFSSSNSNARSLLMKSGTLTLAGTGTVWNASTNANFTLNKGTSTIALTSTASTARTMQMGTTVAHSFGPIIVGPNANRPQLTTGGSNWTWESFTWQPTGGAICFGASTGGTITNAPTMSGTIASPLYVGPAQIGGFSFTLTLGSGTFSLDWGAVVGMTVTGGNGMVATNSFDIGANVGCAISPPAATAAGVAAEVFETELDGYEFGGIVKLLAAAVLGKANGLNTNSPVFRAIDDSKDRVIATTDSAGNRSAVALDAV